MAPFHESYYLLISPGSSTTLVQFGLGETYSPPVFEVPTRVYRHSSIPGGYSSTGDENSLVLPIVGGKIVDVNALNFLLKLVYKGILKDHPQATNVPMLMVSSSLWTKLQIEQLTQYAFETLGVQAFTVIPGALASVYAYGGQQNALVIDIGKDKTEIVPVVDYSVVNSAKKVIPYGGQSIDETLKKILPNYTAEQIDSLKKSNVFEVLSDDDKKKSFFGLDALQQADDGTIDVAEIVTSGRTREILEQRAKHREEDTVPNSQMENNTFVDSNGERLTIGKERFKGCQELINKISDAVFASLEKVVDYTKRQEAWDHIIVIGRTSKIAGFVEALNTQLLDDHLVGKDIQQSMAQQAFQSTASLHVQLTQVPNSLKFARMPEYFPEWKKIGYADVAFLGAQIVAKQMFTTQNESMYVSKQAYVERGPLAFWDLAY